MECLIRKGEVLMFFDTAEMEAVTVTEGRIWLTRYDDHRDYCLEAGARLPTGNSGRIVIEALEDAAVCVAWRSAPAVLTISHALFRHAPSGSSGSSG